MINKLAVSLPNISAKHTHMQSEHSNTAYNTMLIHDTSTPAAVVPLKIFANWKSHHGA